MPPRKVSPATVAARRASQPAILPVTGPVSAGIAARQAADFQRTGKVAKGPLVMGTPMPTKAPTGTRLAQTFAGASQRKPPLSQAEVRDLMDDKPSPSRAAAARRGTTLGPRGRGR